MGCKVLFSLAILAAISALGSACLDCDCLQTQTPQKPLPTLPTLPSLAQLISQWKQKQRNILQSLANPIRNTINNAIDFKVDTANSLIDTAYNAKQLALNPISTEGVQSFANRESYSSGGNSQYCNCIPKSSSSRRVCKKPLPKLYLPKPTFTYVINATNLPQMYQKTTKPKKQLIKCVQTVRTYVQEEEPDQEDCEYDTDNIQYEFVDDKTNEDDVKVNVMKGSSYAQKIAAQNYEETEEVDDTDDVDDDDYIFDKNDYLEEAMAAKDQTAEDNDLLDEEIDITTTPEPTPKPSKRKTKIVKDYGSCECEDDYDIKIKVLRPKSMRNNKYCKCRD